jgi:hypothetical protein
MPVPVAMSVTVAVTVAMSVTVAVTVVMPVPVAMPVTEAMYKVADDVASFVSGLRGPSHARQRKHDGDGTSEDGFHSLFSYASQWGDFTGRRYTLSGQALFPREQDRCRCQISNPSA